MLSERAKKYYEDGLTPLPLAPRGKSALDKGWPNLSLEELTSFFARIVTLGLSPSRGP